VISYSGAWNNGIFGNASLNNSDYLLGGQLWRIKYDDTPAGTINGGAYAKAVDTDRHTRSQHVPRHRLWEVVLPSPPSGWARRMGVNVLRA